MSEAVTSGKVAGTDYFPSRWARPSRLFFPVNFFGKSGEIATNRVEDQELAILSLHLLQVSLVYINTLMIQQVLTEQTWWERMKPDDRRALTPLIYAHITPYGTFNLDLQQRLQLEAA